MLRPIAVSLLSLAIVSTCHAGDAVDIFARAKAASSGSRWDAVKSLHGDGALSAGGLSGAFHETVDLQTGRSTDAYKLGPVEGADGYGGAHAWERDPGGEVAALDAPEAIRRARRHTGIRSGSRRLTARSIHGYSMASATMSSSRRRGTAMR